MTLQAFAQFASDPRYPGSVGSVSACGTAKAAPIPPLAVYEQVAILLCRYQWPDDIAVEKVSSFTGTAEYLKPASRSTGS